MFGSKEQNKNDLLQQISNVPSESIPYGVATKLAEYLTRVLPGKHQVLGVGATLSNFRGQLNPMTLKELGPNSDLTLVFTIHIRRGSEEVVSLNARWLVNRFQRDGYNLGFRATMMEMGESQASIDQYLLSVPAISEAMMRFLSEE